LRIERWSAGWIEGFGLFGYGFAGYLIV